MHDVAIWAERLSKRYRIGSARARHDNLRDAIAHLATTPFRALQQLRQLTHFQANDRDLVWAISDVTFEVKRGEVYGIIGRNGAGKTTLLRILSRITEPTAGRAVVGGRVGALLEIGTGFHADLTGRENAYLNGSILGMDKGYIDRRLDEIVEFAGVQKFIDTPVKRYSSGMYLRLAFAIAAHMEPEILVVDEVLAVGDAAFRSKCIQKMSNIAHEGRTVLFVTHDMGLVQGFCDRVLYLDGGRVKTIQTARDAVSSYLGDLERGLEESGSLVDAPRTLRHGEVIRIARCDIRDQEGTPRRTLPLGQPFSISLEAVAIDDVRDFFVVIGINTAFGRRVATVASHEGELLFSARPGQRLGVTAKFEQLSLNTGQYYVSLCLQTSLEGLDLLDHAARFEVSEARISDSEYMVNLPGDVRCFPIWECHAVAESPRPSRSPA